MLVVRPPVPGRGRRPGAAAGGGLTAAPGTLDTSTTRTTSTGGSMAGKAERGAARSRTDAVRNQRLLVEAAGRAFARSGLQVPVSTVVDEVGLGKGTAFRCFRTKEDLVAAVVAARLSELAAEAAPPADGESPAAALLRFLERYVELLVADRGVAEALGDPVRAHPEIRTAMTAVVEAVDSVVGPAREAGRLRAGVTAVDVVVLAGAVAGTARQLGALGPDAWRRYLRVVVDGLRSGAGLPADGLPGDELPGPAPTAADLDTAMRSAR
ncbi:TetR/AcrR family transcriptional regulator [Saccharothrix yanglingensis]|nr:TetR/AcrR family transcriptional regulator [Saccharothrix yanglingensis]